MVYCIVQSEELFKLLTAVECDHSLQTHSAWGFSKKPFIQKNPSINSGEASKKLNIHQVNIVSEIKSHSK